jgi:hypothetical protein
MKLSYRLLALSAVIASAYGGSVLLSACSGGGNNNNDAGTDGGGVDSGKKDAGPKDSAPPDDSGDDGSTTVPTVDPLCTAPDASPSNGSCAPVDDAGNCDPITNQGCDFNDGGFACDFNQTGFQCYNNPANTAALCAACDVQNGPACLPGSTCVPIDQTTTKCAKYCCTDADCTGGHCDLTTLSQFISPAGVCVK